MYRFQDQLFLERIAFTVVVNEETPLHNLWVCMFDTVNVFAMFVGRNDVVVVWLGKVSLQNLLLNVCLNALRSFNPFSL